MLSALQTARTALKCQVQQSIVCGPGVGVGVGVGVSVGVGAGVGVNMMHIGTE